VKKEFKIEDLKFENEGTVQRKDREAEIFKYKT